MILVSGSIAGLIRTISGPDYFAVIAPLTTRKSNERYRIFFYWSLGHTLGILIIFRFALLLKNIFDIYALCNITKYIIIILI